MANYKMKDDQKLSLLSNTSLGYLPVLISTVLSLIIMQQYALLTGAIVGIMLSSAHYLLNRHQGKHTILYTSTIVVSTCTILCFTGYSGFQILTDNTPLSLEIALFFPLFILYFRRKKIFTLPSSGKPDALNERICMKVLTISSIHNYLWLTAIHCGLIAVFMLLQSLYNTPIWFIIQIVPMVVFVLCMLIAQFNQRLISREKAPEIIPIVTPQGEVVGRIDKHTTNEESVEKHTHPVIRIAIVSHGMLYLNKRPSDSLVEKDKTDLPLESYLLYNEGVKSGVDRLMKEIFGAKSNELLPTFSIKYRFSKGSNSRLVYLFILDLDESDSFCNASYFNNGKLWTFQQIDDNLGKGYFSDTFENEYDHLRLVIETREIYKEF